MSNRYRALWISDVHLGSRDSEPQRLADFLAQNSADTVYLVGDIFDMKALSQGKGSWCHASSLLLGMLSELGSNTPEIIYVPGNHDAPMRSWAGKRLGNIRVEREWTHTTNDGKRYWVTHGDQFEHHIEINPVSYHIGDQSYYLMLRINRWINYWRSRFDKPWWSLANHVKNRVHAARRMMNKFEEVAIRETARRGFDGVICGHIHRAGIRHSASKDSACKDSAVTYANCGDWVDSMTAIVEEKSGALNVLHWHRTPKIARIMTEAVAA
ncbi:UDP-2,3-diacylglucosamine diphosphatase [Microbulbifer agarilyticus]|uniref:UDP-2,3-diacylglucosamine diphosphatase n=1 Tax=Microbulbifer agarilyticus TaxID=260552 RepID=UPI001C93A0F4|nr:UDP-2,3-diacylglucosamine diphosphatase [Microbulbifer agarilyticus]MBY6191370.1 UDP-2,3-diacylglucosamine diphosphatase [Microbulbifer agarilyticus]